jgi:hypothetical protein
MLGALGWASDGKFYKSLRPSIDCDLPNPDKTSENIQNTLANKHGR